MKELELVLGLFVIVDFGLQRQSTYTSLQFQPILKIVSFERNQELSISSYLGKWHYQESNFHKLELHHKNHP